MRRRVVVTGIGCVTPVGNTVPEFWNALKEGKNGIGPITHFDATHFPTKFAAEVKNYDFDKQVEGAIAGVRRLVVSSSGAHASCPDTAAPSTASR